jgi:hypothetical protein
VGLFRTAEAVQDELLHPLSRCSLRSGLLGSDAEYFMSATFSTDNRVYSVVKLHVHSLPLVEDLELQRRDEIQFTPKGYICPQIQLTFTISIE